MVPFNLPAGHYDRLFDPRNLYRFSELSVISSLFGIRDVAILLTQLPIQDVPLFISDPGYRTKISRYYPIYLNKTVFMGFMIMRRKPSYRWTVDSHRVTVQADPGPELKARKHFDVDHMSKQMVVVSNRVSDIFLPSVKYEG